MGQPQPELKTPGAGEGLLHPVPLLAIGLLVLNDHVLKDAFHNAVTGKLSDFAGMAFFPLLLQGLWEGAQSLLRRSWQPSRRALWICAAATALESPPKSASPHVTAEPQSVIKANAPPSQCAVICGVFRRKLHTRRMQSSCCSSSWPTACIRSQASSAIPKARA